MAYEYNCKITRIVDGDTMDCDIDLGFGVWIHKERVRIYGIDTPESRTRDLVEKRFGLAAKDFAKKFLLFLCVTIHQNPSLYLYLLYHHLQP